MFWDISGLSAFLVKARPAIPTIERASKSAGSFLSGVASVDKCLGFKSGIFPFGRGGPLNLTVWREGSFLGLNLRGFSLTSTSRRESVEFNCFKSLTEFENKYPKEIVISVKSCS